MEVNKTVRCHNPHSAFLFLRETALSASSYYKDLISIVLFCLHVILLVFHSRSSFYRSSFLSIGRIEVVKRVKKSLDSEKLETRN